jgi:hypothetical protein
MMRLTSKGDYKKTIGWLKKHTSGSRGDVFSNLDRYGKAGVIALKRATPINSGLTADSWNYRIIRNRSRPAIEWYNTNAPNGMPVAILLQYGHGTGTGGYVRGRDYINPAMKPVFEKIAADFWKEVTSWQK